MAPTPPAFAPLPTVATCITNPNFGFAAAAPTVKTAAIDNSGTANGCSPSTNPSYTCPRPLPPSLFLTDITNNPSARTGDWQQNGTSYLPNKICGIFFYSQKKILGVAADGTVNADIVGIHIVFASCLYSPFYLLFSPAFPVADGRFPIPRYRSSSIQRAWCWLLSTMELRRRIR